MASSQPVRAWVEKINLPTYPALAADPNPMFFETRNIQGSKGNIYPHPFTDQLSSQKVDRLYEAVFLENEYIQMIMLPEIGGRIFAGLDKTNGYDFFYRHTVIKPALIGLFGPWISGGVEFNWPQHHRPTTFDPVDYTIEAHPDGSQTVWMGEHDPLNRTKGMVGICLYPGKAFVETKVRLYNRTPFPQSFLWWENAGVHINEKYQVVFPPDVHYAVYHTKAPVISYPIAKGKFAGGLDYGEGTDVSWWVNSPLATSFFAAESKYEFFGGYDHAKEAGVAHVANGNISPGKKYFTWANGPFGHSWQRNLMDDEGEYLELMAGVYTDNQPDFTWIAPYETKTFSQFWLPVQKIGAMKNANLRAAVNLEVRQQNAFVGVYATAPYSQARVVLSSPGQTWLDESVDLAPGKPYTKEVSLPADLAETDLLLRLLDAQGAEIIRYQPEIPWDGCMAEPYQPPAEPAAVATLEELYLIGLHLEQYRHPGIAPETYWQEALRRDPGDARCNLALGRLALRRGDFNKAEEHFRLAIKRLTWRNFNPSEGEAHYNLGLALQYQGRLDEAYKAFYKGTWTYPWQAAGFYALAQIDCLRKDYSTALEHLDRSLQVNTANHKARNLKAAVLRKLGQPQAAGKLAAETLALDLLDFWARNESLLAAPVNAEQAKAELKALLRSDVQTCLDIAGDYAAAGFWSEATDFLEMVSAGDGLYPMVAYALGYCARQMGDAIQSQAWYARGEKAPPDYCFPWRLEEMIILRDALAVNPQDARACYYLGNLLYDKKHYAEAVELWKKAVSLEPGLAIPWRNLGLASFNLDRDLSQAIAYFQKARAANPQDARLLLEYDNLLRRKGVPPEERLALLEQNPSVTAQREDLIMERMVLNNRLGRPLKTLEIAASGSFHPWEGGEGTVGGQYANAHWLMGRQALEAGDAETALQRFTAGLDCPANLGEVPFGGETVHLKYYQGLAYEALGQAEQARAAYEQVLTIRADYSTAVYYRPLALIKLGKAAEAEEKLRSLEKSSAALAEEGVKSNYFYFGKPNPTFEDDLKQLYRPYFLTLVGLARLGLGDKVGARNALGQALSLDPSILVAYEEWKRL